MTLFWEIRSLMFKSMINRIWYGLFRITCRINPRPISSLELKLSGWHWCRGLIWRLIRENPYDILYLSHLIVIWQFLHYWYNRLWVSVLKPRADTGADMDFQRKTHIRRRLLLMSVLNVRRNFQLAIIRGLNLNFSVVISIAIREI